MVSAAGNHKPVLVSPDVVIAGADTVPACTVVTPVADNVVNAPVFAVVAPTVPLILMLAVPVKLVTVPELGVPNAPPSYNNVAFELGNVYVFSAVAGPLNLVNPLPVPP